MNDIDINTAIYRALVIAYDVGIDLKGVLAGEGYTDSEIEIIFTKLGIEI